MQTASGYKLSPNTSFETSLFELKAGTGPSEESPLQDSKFTAYPKHIEKYRTPRWTTVFKNFSGQLAWIKKFNNSDEFRGSGVSLFTGNEPTSGVDCRVSNSDLLRFEGSNKVLSNFGGLPVTRVQSSEVNMLKDPFANIPDLEVGQLKESMKYSGKTPSALERSGKRNATCICNRPTAEVRCSSCSYRCRGRVRRVCPVHPRRMDLMDIHQCWNCSSDDLWEE